MSTPKILAFAGSARKGSYNKRVLAVAVAAAKQAGGDVTTIDLADYPLPIMDEDLEFAGGLPENAIELKELFKAHDGLLLACPEYNSSITPMLKNVIDWVSRPREGEYPLECFDQKVCGLLGASPGALGGLRGLFAVRSILSCIKVIVLPEMAAVGQAHEKFEGETIGDEKVRRIVEQVGERVVDVVLKMR